MFFPRLNRLPGPWVRGLSLVLVALSGWIDYSTGSELRVYPLYFIPVTLAAMEASRSWGLTIAGLSTVTWFAANFLGGTVYSHFNIWIFNSLAQGVSFILVSFLIFKLRDRIEHETTLARTDSLTGLLNSRAFYEATAREIDRARRYGRPLTIAYLDVDDFKEVNDALGHLGGDRLLCTIADFLRQSVRATDVVARLGGDEFALVLTEVGCEEARHALERLHQRVAQRVKAGEHGVTTSIGAVWFSHPFGEVDHLLKTADELMYEVKGEGKNAVRLITHEVAQTSQDEKRRTGTEARQQSLP